MSNTNVHPTGQGNILIPTRLVTKNGKITPSQVMSFCVLRMINPEIQLMRVPMLTGDIVPKNHPEWAYVDFDDSDPNVTTNMSTTKTKNFSSIVMKYGSMLSQFSCDASINLFVRSIARLIDERDDNISSTDTQVFCIVIDAFNPNPDTVSTHRDNPYAGNFDYTYEDAFIDAADAMQPLLARIIDLIDRGPRKDAILYSAIDTCLKAEGAVEKYVAICDGNVPINLEVIIKFRSQLQANNISWVADINPQNPVLYPVCQNITELYPNLKDFLENDDRVIHFTNSISEIILKGDMSVYEKTHSSVHEMIYSIVSTIMKVGV